MSAIRVLDYDISNKIAAGEVVENSSSVVKELIENAIDAGATSLTVEIQNGGISYIRVTDNGSGIEADDVKTAFLRHATSKISTAADLERISTLGFRGEALSSIAAVSRIKIMTKTKHGEGVLVELDAGRVTKEEACGCPDGTTVEVYDLFYNTPARMKFLKSDRTETARVTDIVERLVLGNPNISIKYIADGRDRLFFGGDGSIQSCVYSIYGREYARLSTPVSRSENGITVSGLAGKAEASRGNRGFQSFFVNGRYVKNRALTYAVESAYENALMVGRFPFFVIHIEIPFDMVDINVHPSKQEVKFANEKAVCDEVYRAVKSALATGADDIRRAFLQSPNRVLQNPSFSTANRFGVASALNEPLNLIDSAFMTAIAQTPPEQPKKENTSYKIIGQLFKTYIIVELEDRIVLIDQHAAHERMIFERLKKSLTEKTPFSQILLSPVAVTLSPGEYAVFKENLNIFSDLGFETEDFGNNSVLVRQIPADVAESEIKALLCELIEKIDKPGGAMPEGFEDMLEMIACKAAIKGNQSLGEEEVIALIDEVLNEGGVSTCPHGRPLMLEITRHEIEKMFKRIV
ncbi:MAG: DNA mismatch repair protein MutL [Firmicutes bacterium ADurb.Bin193]|nr:MAG: DNA mismatch repair protein MutL [Firmicutes bacterium ADurb.Bin193]